MERDILLLLLVLQQNSRIQGPVASVILDGGLFILNRFVYE